MNTLIPNLDMSFYKKMIFFIFCISFISLCSQTGYASTDENADSGSIRLQAVVPDVHEKILMVPTDSSPPIRLQVTVYTPDRTGRFPMVIINHGNDDKPPRDQPRSRLSFASLYFLSRGYAVVQPMMRGYAGSEGMQSQNGCDLVADNMHNAEDIRTLIEYMSNQPDIDGSRVIVAGQSFGGYNTLAVGPLNIPAVKGLINFNGGMGIKQCSDAVNRMVDTAGYFGAHTKIPSIWFYGTNDILIPESTWRAAYHRYTLLGGDARLISIGNFMDNSHNFLGHVEGIAIIQKPLDDFLHELGLPNTIKYSGFVPSPAMSATHFAEINDINAVPINPQLIPQYQIFLTKPLPRVFLINENGGISISVGGINPLDTALESCKKAQIKCWPYAIDNQVVWVKPTLTPIPPPSHYADIKDLNAVPIMGDQAKAAYQAFLETPLPRVFVLTNQSEIYSDHGGLDPLGNVLNTCKKRSQICIPYAVDNQVVWSPTADFLKPTHFADIRDFEAVPYMNVIGQKNYQKFLTLNNPRAFVVSPDGTSTMASGSESLKTALSKCENAHHGCAPYALNDDVVWNPH